MHIHTLDFLFYIMLRVIELFSGIGGVHSSLKKLFEKEYWNMLEATVEWRSFSIVAAYEINTVANYVYSYNFPGANLQQRNIMSLSAEELDSINADLWTMSPPCQPFTRQGNQKDIEDNRTNPLRHIQREMTKMKNLPKYFFLENVKGFETSLARDQLISTLKQCGYHFREFLLSPNQFGIPNSRLRYYLVAKANADFRLECDRLITETMVNQSPTRLIAEYMEDKPEAYFEKFLVDDKLLLKYAEIFDITSAESCRSCCFTKAYSHYVRGTGSVIQQAAVDINEIYTLFRQSASNEEKLQQIQKLKLRFFTPKEILNLSGFGKDFSFPGETSLRQQYQLLGNSINVDVVAHLLEILLSNTLHSKPIC